MMNRFQRVRATAFLTLKGLWHRMTVGARVMVVDGDKVLLIRHTYEPGWQFPGGGVGPGEKEFLSLDDEITAVVGTRVHLTINWGRSVVESHDPELPARQVARLADAGVLGGVMLSGAGPDATQYGPAWGDAHLPLRNDEPTSLLTTDLVGSFLDAARGLQAYQGIKIQTPADATVERRLAMITSIHDVMATA